MVNGRLVRDKSIKPTFFIESVEDPTFAGIVENES